MAWYDSLFSGGNPSTSGNNGWGGGILSAALPAAIMVGGQYLSGRNTQDWQQQLANQQNQWQTQRDTQQHQYAMETLQQQMEQSMAEAEMAAEVQKEAIRQRAYEAAMQMALQGGQLRGDAIARGLQGIQAPYMNKNSWR